ncbi:MAG: hypothetical protein A3C43_08035 [Candidatus Schekmanbacteria bacterium RIFCSPHIGHO2_02_FULL_38_11]|uniref:PilZ domain-containing protein n=1 Tax=Candidatus Schekmanbacteria bacterium RIFCSPLOWO2_12_FULL_38_15 TaxID=1817883 RepID=A0A1F7SL56_9BACT|nr:MAG: hypothetical protein A2043_05835 [Candidatus Schekmanbacteria bacterium GWA2_38_9]OGL48016.1 MAG: hypothetical protein A3H37_08305 [Candidatus Schekmanbacteria bacterium RIFCSPLOWO2_02_FULL_38_14]OGL48331.1 MAG: hypothetical protein A3C43_08035 [Candidatus Schekmanbacteria bacterium RIFCSPHIGHO2_02_FULL_38_11]OGL54499.1 MAG: hypothetical protein A3G31_10085 [Candidatus Schekmanbacteria bacterium RIFCSPLOWO2_12_FULL_38_15]
MKKNIFKEKRGYPRIKSLHLNAYNYFDQKEYEKRKGIALTLNISLSGMFIESGVPFPIHSVLEITLALEEILLTLKGEVRRSEIAENGNYHLGIFFVDISPESQKILNTLIPS